MTLDNKVLDAIIAGLLGVNHKGEPNPGLISAMQPGTARARIIEAIAALPDEEDHAPTCRCETCRAWGA